MGSHGTLPNSYFPTSDPQNGAPPLPRLAMTALLGLGGPLSEELEECVANFLDRTSVGLFTAASRACQRAARERLATLKKEYDDALAAAAAAEAARPRRITFNAAGGAFIDSFVGAWTNATPAQRNVLCQHVLDAAATQPACGSTSWTVQKVRNRLKNRAHHMLNAAT